MSPEAQPKKHNPVGDTKAALGVVSDADRPIKPVPGRRPARLLIRGGVGSFWLKVAMTLGGILSIALICLIAWSGYLAYRHFTKSEEPAPAADPSAPDLGGNPVSEIAGWCHPDRTKILWGPVVGVFSRPGEWPKGLRVVAEDTARGVTRRTYQVGGTRIEIQQVRAPNDSRGLMRIHPDPSMDACSIMQATGWMGIDSFAVRPGTWDLVPSGSGFRSEAVWSGNRVQEIRIGR